jgi:hypothetical protein
MNSTAGSTAILFKPLAMFDFERSLRLRLERNYDNVYEIQGGPHTLLSVIVAQPPDYRESVHTFVVRCPHIGGVQKSPCSVYSGSDRVFLLNIDDEHTPEQILDAVLDFFVGRGLLVHKPVGLK